MKPKTRKRINVSFEPSIFAGINQRAKEKDISIALFINLVMTNYIAKTTNDKNNLIRKLKEKSNEGY